MLQPLCPQDQAGSGEAASLRCFKPLQPLPLIPQRDPKHDAAGLRLYCFLGCLQTPDGHTAQHAEPPPFPQASHPPRPPAPRSPPASWSARLQTEPCGAAGTAARCRRSRCSAAHPRSTAPAGARAAGTARRGPPRSSPPTLCSPAPPPPLRSASRSSSAPAVARSWSGTGGTCSPARPRRPSAPVCSCGR